MSSHRVSIKSRSNLRSNTLSAQKENVEPLEDKKARVSLSYRDQMINDVKATASRTFSSVRSRIDNISQRLRHSTRRKNSFSGFQKYDQLENDQKTPVKLYSPFGIVTPSPHKQTLHSPRRRATPRRCTFVSPTGKLKKDIEDLASGIQELNTVARTLSYRKKNKK